MTDKVAILRRFEIFAGFSDAEIVEIAALCQEEACSEGDILFTEGETAEKLFLFLEGKVSLETKVQLGRSGSARRATVSVVGPSQVAGWSSLIAPHQYTSTGVCVEPGRALILKGEEVRHFVYRHPASGLRCLLAGQSPLRARRGVAPLRRFLSREDRESSSVGARARVCVYRPARGASSAKWTP